VKLIQYTLELKWALIYSLVFLLWMIAERLTGLHDTYIYLHPMITALFVIPAISVYAFGLADYKKDLFYHRISLGKGFLFGMRLTLAITLLSPFMQLIVSNVITPDFFKNAIEYTVTHGMKTRAEAESYFNLNSYLGMSVFGSLAMGIVAAFLVALGFVLFQFIQPARNGK